jgi:hypothetical protein
MWEENQEGMWERRKFAIAWRDKRRRRVGALGAIASGIAPLYWSRQGIGSPVCVGDRASWHRGWSRRGSIAAASITSYFYRVAADHVRFEDVQLLPGRF